MENKPKERVMKWTEQKDKRMMDLISEHNKLSDGFAHAAKKLRCSKSAIVNRYYKVMKTRHMTNASLSDIEKAKWATGKYFDQEAYQQGMIKVLRNIEAPVIIHPLRKGAGNPIEIQSLPPFEPGSVYYIRDKKYKVINPPIESCEAGAVNYMQEPKIEKLKSFIEKVKAFFKGGNHE